MGLIGFRGIIGTGDGEPIVLHCIGGIEFPWEWGRGGWGTFWE